MNPALTETKEYDLPFSDSVELEVSYNRILSRFTIASRMPNGLPERNENKKLTENDWDFLRWIVDDYTNKSFRQLLNSDDSNDKEVAYILNITIETILGKEITSWEEYKGEEEFVSKGSLGVQ
jgi:hypothetical protein